MDTTLKTFDLGGGSGTFAVPTDLFNTAQQQIKSGVDVNKAITDLTASLQQQGTAGKYNLQDQNISRTAYQAGEFNSPISQFLKNALLNQSNDQIIDRGGQPGPTAPGREPAPTVQPLSAQEIAQNKVAEQAYQQRLAAMGGVGVAPGAQTVQTPTAQAPVSTYQGSSIVDFLNSVGQNSSFASRQALAAQNGITGYTGSATQNTQLLNALRSKQQGGATPALSSGQKTVSSSPSGAVNSSGQVVDSAGNVLGQANPADQYPVSTKTGVGKVDNSPSGVTEVYSKLYKDLGLSDIKTQFEKVMKQSTDLQNELNDKIADINEDPWLSQGVRDQRINQLKSRYETRLDTLSNQQQLYKSFYDDGIQQAQFLTGQIMTEQHQQQVLDAQVQQNAIENAQRALDAQAKLTEVSPGATLYDPKTGKAVFTAPYKNSGSDPTSNLTTTQINKGVSNSGLTRESFTKLSPEVQIFYANLNATQKGQLDGMIGGVKTDYTKATDAITAIEGKNFSEPVSSYLRDQIIQNTTIQQTQSKVPEMNTWDKFLNLFGV